MTANARQLRSMCPAGAEVVLAVGFEPADWGTASENFHVMLGAQADSSG